jgi:uncharacterized protein YndB with AHSA1/START domain
MASSIPPELVPAAEPIVRKSVTIDVPSTLVWEALTVPERMNEWMFPEPIEIVTTWQVGHAIVIRGDLHGAAFENTGTVLEFRPEALLAYSHLSSTSRLPDVPENHSVIEFGLTALTADQTELTVTVRQFPTDVIYRHLAYYWNVTPEVIKRKLEARPAPGPSER